jgi:hypothetical protein
MIRFVIFVICGLACGEIVRLLYEPARKKRVEEKIPFFASHPNLFGWGIVVSFLALYVGWTFFL